MDESVVQLKLSKNALFKELERRCEEDVSLHTVIALIQAVGEYSVSISKSIIMNMNEYTLHDENHIFNMLYLASKFIPQETLSKISTPDIMMIILTIFLHDIGMSPSGEVIRAWKNQLSPQEAIRYEDEMVKFQRF